VASAGHAAKFLRVPVILGVGGPNRQMVNVSRCLGDGAGGKTNQIRAGWRPTFALGWVD
jgi:hypothetical protein